MEAYKIVGLKVANCFILNDFLLLCEGCVSIDLANFSVKLLHYKPVAQLVF